MKEVRSVSIESDVWKRIDELASALNVSRSEYVEKLLREGTESDETTVKVMTNPALMTAMSKAFGDPSVMRAFVSAIRGEVDQDQLELFMQTMETAKEKVVSETKKKQAAQIAIAAQLRNRGPRPRRKHK